MAFTLEQLDFLNLKVGIAIPPEFIENKKREALYQKRAAEFTARDEEVKKRADHADVEHLLEQGKAAAGTKKFADALRFLDQAEEQLKKPDIAPEVLAALKELETRQAAFEAEIARVKAAEGPMGAELKKGLDEVTEARKTRNVEGATKRLGDLEKMLADHEKEKQAAAEAAAKAKAEELARLKAHVEELKKKVEAGVASIQQVVGTIQDEPLKKPCSEALEKLRTSLEAALKHEQPAEQETALTELEKGIAPAKAAADKAAQDSAALIAARERVAKLKLKADTELKAVDTTIKSIGEPALATPEAQKHAALSTRFSTHSGTADIAEQEKEFTTLLADIAKCKQEAEAAKVKADEAKAAKARIAQLETEVDAVITEIQAKIDGLVEAALKPGAEALQTPLKTERTRINSVTALDAKEAALTKLKNDAAAAKTKVENIGLWDGWLKDSWKEDYDATKAWVGVVKSAPAKAVLTAELDAVLQEKENFLAANDCKSIETVTFPKLDPIYDAAHRIGKQDGEVDKDIHKLKNLLVALKKEVTDAAITGPIQAEYTAVENDKKSSWPGSGATSADLIKDMDDFDDRVKNLRTSIDDARGKALGKDATRKTQKIEQIEKRLEKIDHALSDVEGIKQKDIDQLPATEQAVMVKMVTELKEARKTYKALSKRLKDAPKIKNFAARGKELTALDRESLELVESVLRRSMKSMSKVQGTGDLDKMIKDMPNHVGNSEEKAMAKAAIEARYGIKIEIGEEFEARSLPRIGKMLARVPEWQAKQTRTAPDGTAKEKSLKALKYSTEPSGKGNYYSSSRKEIALQGMTEKGVDDEHRLESDSGKAVKTSYFDFTTLHEIGHAVDDRINFMGQRMNKAGFGDWKKETFDSVLAAFLPGLVADCTGGTKKANAADLEAMLTDLIKTGACAKPANATGKLGSLFDEWDTIQGHAIVTKCKAGMYTACEPWDKGKARAEAIQLGGRVYQESYDNTWHSYALADRATTGVSTYQWRAPGEWFAEIYALYYLNKLSRSHPMSAWFRNSAKSEAAASKA